MLRSIAPIAFFLAATFSCFAGTLVDIRMPIGTVRIELYDEDKPITVANFLNYIESGRYQNSFSHRLDSDFIVQGGGFKIEGTSVNPVETFAPIQNEYSVGTTYSNLYGTVAMARVGEQVNSATSQWFINLANNAFLDTVDEGFTVFGHVVSGFHVLERLNTTFDDDNLQVDGIFNASSQLGDNFKELPLLSNSLDVRNILFTEVKLADLNSPITKVTSPSKRTVTITRPRFRFAGTASDDEELKAVYFRVGSGPWIAANGTTKWKASIRLKAKRTKIQVRAEDVTGNSSAIQTIIARLKR